LTYLKAEDFRGGKQEAFQLFLFSIIQRRGPGEAPAEQLPLLRLGPFSVLEQSLAGIISAKEKPIDTRTPQVYLGHRSIQSTVRYTELAPGRFKNLWR
jgi:hypothetical protein